MIPKESAIVIPTHIPGVKKPSGPGRLSRSGLSAMSRLHQLDRSPEELVGKQEAAGPTAMYIQIP